MKIFPVLILIMVAGCTQTPRISSDDIRQVDSTSMHVVYGVPFDEFFVAPTNLSNYDAIIFDILSLDNLVIDTRRLDFDDRKWEFRNKEKVFLKEDFAKKVDAVFGKPNGLRLATNPGDGVLKVHFELVKFAPNAPKDDIKNRAIREKILTRSVGDLKVKAKITDSVTGELIAVLEDTEEVGDNGFLEINDRVNNTRRLRNELENWIRSLKRALEKLKTA